MEDNDQQQQQLQKQRQTRRQRAKTHSGRIFYDSTHALEER